MYSYKTELSEIELIICIKMDLELNNLQRLTCHKNQPTNQPDLCLPNRNYLDKIIKKQNKNWPNLFFRLCEQKTEWINHLVSGCPILTLTENKERQYKIGYILIENMRIPGNTEIWKAA